MITTEYRGKTLQYRETDDLWTCEDFEHGRGSPTLTQAKARVDKMLDGLGDKPKPFDKVEVWSDGFAYQQGWRKITLTSKAEGGYWATDGKDRKKLSRDDSSKLKLSTPENTTAIEVIMRMESQIETIRQQIKTATKQLDPFKP